MMKYENVNYLFSSFDIVRICWQDNIQERLVLGCGNDVYFNFKIFNFGVMICQEEDRQNIKRLKS